MKTENSNKGPLFGLKIVEFAGIGPAPLTGQLLSDLGAHVIKIDRELQDRKSSNILDRNKNIITLDLKSARGKELAKKLICKADVLIEGFRPGVMERLELGPTDCEKINKSLIYGRITGWGQDGPYSQKAGHDINYLSITGALHAIGMKNAPPIPPLNLLADYAGGTMFLILGVLSALWERNLSGKGQVVDAAMVEGVPALMSLIYSYLAEKKWKNERMSNLLDGGCPYYRCYETKDGKYISVGALENKFFAILIKQLGLNESWISEQTNQEKWPQLGDELRTVFLTKTREEIREIFNETDACVEPILTFDEVENQPHNLARDIFIRIEGVLQANPAPKFSRTPTEPISNKKDHENNQKSLFKIWGIDENFK